MSKQPEQQRPEWFEKGLAQWDATVDRRIKRVPPEAAVFIAEYEAAWRRHKIPKRIEPIFRGWLLRKLEETDRPVNVGAAAAEFVANWAKHGPF